jgi:pimeloyl-ACP methyl ester carboxylesterase
MSTRSSAGGRPRLVIVHGLLGSLAGLELERYLPDVEVIQPDLTGYGRRRDETQGIDLASQARELARLLREDIGEPVWLLGHSTGGVVAMLVADAVPELVRGLIDVEGNFTLKDAFWCSRIAPQAEADWAAEYGAMEDAPGAWLERIGIESSDERIGWTRVMLANQPYTTVQELARSVLDVTGAPDYLETVRDVLERGTPVWLVGGEQSAAGWDVPDWVMADACGIRIQPKAGHMMMLDDPRAFCAVVAGILQEPGRDAG